MQFQEIEANNDLGSPTYSRDRPACSQTKPFPETQAGSLIIEEATSELINKYPGFVIFSGNTYSSSDKLVRIAMRFEGEKIPAASIQKNIINDLFADIAVRAQQPDWKPLFQDTEIEIVALSAVENEKKDQEILLAAKKKNSNQLQFVH
ncbi:hypothetical protein [Saccharibacillus qingshengii]|uniref:hypothetical protein n=1 Tax=Saccharibacillus qingshengii TaxID=1763540 RepID=UPI001551F66F|nr:hypothetical protein [Saccharibacillus qingshengii]